MDAGSVRPRAAAWLRGLPERHGKGTLAILAVLLVLSLGLRVARALDPVEAPGPDSEAYSAIASHLYKTGEYGTPGMENESDWSPGAVLFYATVYIATGGVREEAARLAVALLGAALVLVVYALARRLTRAANAGRLSRSSAGAGGAPPPLSENIAGLTAALAVAIYPAFVYDAGRLMSEPFAELALAATTLSFLWASEPDRSPSSYLLPGTMLGLTALFRPEYLPFSLLLAALAALWAWRQGRDARRTRGQALWPALVFLAAFVLVIAPWTIRNAIELDRFIPVSTGGGKALFIGTYLPGDGDHFGTKRALFYASHPESDLTPEKVNMLPMQPLLDAIAARRPELERDAALGAEGRENLERYVAERPFVLLAMSARKIWRMWRSGSGPSMDGVAPQVLHAALALAGLGGLTLLGLRRRPEALLIALLVAGITAIGAILLASTRRNLILMPIVISLAGVASSWLVSLLRSPDGIEDPSQS